MSAHRVSPPTGGTSMARSTEPSDGSSRQVTSLCQMFSTPLASALFSRRSTSGASSGWATWMLDERMVLEPAPSARRSAACCVPGDVLPAEEQHLPLQQRPVELGVQRVVDRIGKRDASDHRADGGRQRLDAEALIWPRVEALGHPCGDAGPDPRA